jgi:penicillin-binding protein A
MVRRVRSGKVNGDHTFLLGRLNIPRKGRIRAILIILFLVIAVKLMSHRQTPDGHVPVKAQPAAVADRPATLKKNTRSFFRLPFFRHADNRQAAVVKTYGLSHANIVDLLKVHAPVFQLCRDTIVRDKKRYVVYYSIDTALQKCGETLLKRYHPKYGAFIVMETGTGRVRSLVSYTRDGEDSLGENLYCKSIFPAASVFKTVTAAAAVEKAHVSPDSTFSLAGRRYTLYKFQLAQELASCQDITLADAYCQSVNPVFGRIGLYVVGKAGLTEYMRKFGFNCAIPFDLDNEKPTSDENMKDSLLIIAEAASGFNTVTRISPLFGALIASSIAENGVMPVPTLVDSVYGDSCIVYRAAPGTWRTPIKENTASALKDMMSRVVQKGTARHSFHYARNSTCFIDVEYGGKTGSVDEDTLGKIDWFIGFARHKSDPKQRLAVGVVTVHDEYWTVHSSFIGEELFRTSLSRTKKAEKKGHRIAPVIGSDAETTNNSGAQTEPDSQDSSGEIDDSQ